MRQERGDLRVESTGNVDPVVGFVGAPQIDPRWPVLRDSVVQLLWEEQVVASSHHSIDRSQSGYPVVGMELIALPWIVGEDYVGSQAPDP